MPHLAERNERDKQHGSQTVQPDKQFIIERRNADRSENFCKDKAGKRINKVRRFRYRHQPECLGDEPAHADDEQQGDGQRILEDGIKLGNPEHIAPQQRNDKPGKEHSAENLAPHVKDKPAAVVKKDSYQG